MDRAGANVEGFLQALAAVCREFGMSISHEDGHGNFQVAEWSQGNEDWLLGADSGGCCADCGMSWWGDDYHRCEGRPT